MLATQPKATIRRMSLDDLRLALHWAAAEGWNPGLRDFVPFFATDPAGLFVATIDDQPIGSVAAVAYGKRYGFIGLYLVRPEFRGKRIGITLGQTAIAHLGARTIGTDGVMNKQKQYARYGFQTAYHHIRHKGLGAGSAPEGLVDLRDVPPEELIAYDARHFGAARSRFLHAWIRQSGTLALGAMQDDRLVGMGVLRPCRDGFKIGPLTADDPSTAEWLYQALASSRPGAAIYLDTPDANGAALELARRHRMEPVFQTARMYLGDPPDMALLHVFGATTLELG